MSDPPVRPRFIPFRRRDVVELCLAERRLGEAEAVGFRQLCDILAALLHFEYHSVLEALKDAYAPFDPDADTRTVREPDDEDRDECRRRFLAELHSLLRAANFEEITEVEVNAAFERESLLDIRLHVDFGDFAEFAFFRRCEDRRTVERTAWYGLKRREVEITNLDRVVVYVRFQDADYFEAAGRTQLNFEPGSTVLKLFQNVPRGDLEMLFPNVEVRMRTVDKVLIGLPALVSGAAVVATKVITSIGVLLVLVGFWLGLHDEEVEVDQGQLLALGAGLGSLGAYLFKQFSKFKNRKIRFMKALADNLYFKNLDNDAGVFHNLLDAAEEEEAKEALLAYFFLLTSDGSRSADEIDRSLEEWFAERLDCRLDFDVVDAVAKLERLGLVERQDDRYAAVPLHEAKRRLDATWDGAFTWNDDSSPTDARSPTR